MADKKKNGAAFYLRVSGILLAICAVVALMLAGIHFLTETQIEANITAEKRGAIREFFADMSEFPAVEYKGGDTRVSAVYRVLSADGKELGYCVSAVTKGFGGDMELMIGIGADGKVSGVKIISHSETKAAATEKSYLEKYIGKSGQLELGRDVDAIANVTYSSKAVLSGVNAATAAVAEIKGGDAE